MRDLRYPLKTLRTLVYKLLIIGPEFYSPSVNSAFCFVARRYTRRSANGTQLNDWNDQTLPIRKRYGADAGRIRWRRIVTVNETTEIRSLVSRSPQNILSYQWHPVDRAAFSGHTSLIATLSIVKCFTPHYIIKRLQIKMRFLHFEPLSTYIKNHTEAVG